MLISLDIFMPGPKISPVSQLHTYTFSPRMFVMGCFWLETTIMQKNQNGRLKKTEIFKSANSPYFSEFQGLVLTNFESAILIFFSLSPSKSGTNYGIEFL